jgi:hypothetical protein
VSILIAVVCFSGCPWNWLRLETWRAWTRAEMVVIEAAGAAAGGGVRTIANP